MKAKQTKNQKKPAAATPAKGEARTATPAAPAKRKARTATPATPAKGRARTATAATPAKGGARTATAATPAKGKARTATQLPPALAKVTAAAAAASSQNHPAARLMKCLFDCASPEPRKEEIELARADLAAALQSGTDWMFPGYARHDSAEAAKAAKRAEIVRTVAAWVKGDAAPPAGATRADALLRGIAWEGWEWNLRGETISEPKEDAIETAERWAEALRRAEREATELLEYSTARGRKPRGNPVTPAREAAEELLNALEDEEAARCELANAEKAARATLPVAELAAAKARLAGAAVEELRMELRGVAEGVANLAAVKRKTSKVRRDAGRMGGEESARQRADAERERNLAAAFQRMRRGIAAGKSIRQAARDAMRKGEPLLKSNGDALREDSLVRYFKAAKKRGGA